MKLMREIFAIISILSLKKCVFGFTSRYFFTARDFTLQATDLSNLINAFVFGSAPLSFVACSMFFLFRPFH